MVRTVIEFCTLLWNRFLMEYISFYPVIEFYRILYPVIELIKNFVLCYRKMYYPKTIKFLNKFFLNLRLI